MVPGLSNNPNADGAGAADSPGGRKPSRGKLSHVDSLHLEAGRVSGATTHRSKAGWATTLLLAFQSIGVVYGDMGTSPLYVYSSTFTNGIKDTKDLLGVLSLILYTVLLIPMFKYIFIVLRANDNGDGGTFALYSLICRYARVSLIPNQQTEDAMLSNYNLETPSTQMKRAHWIKEKMENSTAAKYILFLVTILGTSMVIGDGVLTPCISVLSAVGGIQLEVTSLTQGMYIRKTGCYNPILKASIRDKYIEPYAPIICDNDTLEIKGKFLLKVVKQELQVDDDNILFSVIKFQY